LVVTPSDAEVAARVRGGDIEAFAVLVDRHHARLVRHAWHMLGNLADAEEVVQDSFVRAFQALGRYDERDQFGAWLTRILVNRCRTAVARRRDEEPLDEATLVWANGEDRAEAMAVREELAHALAQLPHEQREALVLRYTEDRTFDEMAALTGAGVSALKMRVKRACERLRALLEESRARI
jgi:RNA polymerase sigma-70 factor (ECF subfamily)